MDHPAHKLVAIWSELSMLLLRQFWYLHLQSVNFRQQSLLCVLPVFVVLYCGCTVFLCVLCDLHNKVQLYPKALSWCLEWRLFFVVDPEPSVLFTQDSGFKFLET